MGLGMSNISQLVAEIKQLMSESDAQRQILLGQLEQVRARRSAMAGVFEGGHGSMQYQQAANSLTKTEQYLLDAMQTLHKEVEMLTDYLVHIVQ